MQHVNRGFELAVKYFPLALVAALADLLNIADITRRYSSGFHFKFTIPTALPSLVQVLPDPPAAGGSFVNINIPFAFLGAVGLLIFLAVILLSAYIKGGYLGCILEGLKGREVSRVVFLAYAGRFWFRFLMQSVILLTAMIFLGLLLVGIGPLAVLFIFILLVAFLLLVFWDYSIILDDLGVVDAAERSWRLVTSNLGSVILFFLPILVITALFSIIAAPMVAFPLVLGAIVAYAFLGTAVISGIMSFYMELTGFGEGPGEEEF